MLTPAEQIPLTMIAMEPDPLSGRRLNHVLNHLPWILLPDAMELYIANRQTSHFETAPNGNLLYISSMAFAGVDVSRQNAHSSRLRLNSSSPARPWSYWSRKIWASNRSSKSSGNPRNILSRLSMKVNLFHVNLSVDKLCIEV